MSLLALCLACWPLLTKDENVVVWEYVVEVFHGGSDRSPEAVHAEAISLLKST